MNRIYKASVRIAIACKQQFDQNMPSLQYVREVHSASKLVNQNIFKETDHFATM